MRRPLVAMACVLVVAACQNGSAPIASRSPLPSAGQSPNSASSQSPLPAATYPSPGIDLPLSRVTFSCRLPVLDSKSAGDGATMQGGFITFPQATYAADPAGTIQSEYVARDLVTMATPALHGTGGGAFYDASMRRWVPVPAGQASPDGKRYAYVTGESPNVAPAQVHIVNVVDGSEAVVTIGPNPELNEWRIGDYDGSLVF